MLRLSDSLINQPVLSLRTGQQVAVITSAIFNPNNLKVEGFYCSDSYDHKELVLLYQDIREVLQTGFVINDHDVLADPEDLVRLTELLRLRFELVGKQVQTISKQKLGKVSDYAVETDTMFVQKIYATQSILKALTGGTLSIDRTQINEITNKRIIINDLLKDSAVSLPAAAS
jgi:uncharacterized protein YrrD